MLQNDVTLPVISYWLSSAEKACHVLEKQETTPTFRTEGNEYQEP